MKTRIYKLTSRARKLLLDAEKRRGIERSMLDTFCCPHCGETEPPFLDYFGLDLQIDCDGCGFPGELRDFLDING